MLGRLSGDNVEKYHPVQFVQLGLLSDKEYGHKGQFLILHSKVIASEDFDSTYIQI